MYSWQITLDALLYIIDTKVNDPSSGVMIVLVNIRVI